MQRNTVVRINMYFTVRRTWFPKASPQRPSPYFYSNGASSVNRPVAIGATLSAAHEQLRDE